MPDHTEREREARRRTALAMQRERVERTMESWDAVFACIDDERAAVRSAVLAEVRAKVDALALDWPTLFTTADGTGYVRHTDIRAAIDAARTTGGRDA